MLCKNSNLLLKNGANIDLPRLIPSFSSKGFPFDKEGKISETSNALELLGPTINDSILISAYDMKLNYLNNPQSFFGNKDLIIIDSGGYELSNDYDSTESVQYPYEPNKIYDIDGYTEILSSLDYKQPIVMTNFDHTAKGKSIVDQIINAQELFHKFPLLTHDFIIKPTGQRDYLSKDVDEIISHLEKMQKFDILGLTEKELGNTLLERMKNIAKIRHALDEKALNIPIHIWGGLDPMVSILYFIMGAELFDGISWLKYGFRNGSAITQDSFTALELGVQIPWYNADVMRMASNISYLYNLQINMQRFVKIGGNNFSIFGEIGKSVERAYEVVSAKLNFL